LAAGEQSIGISAYAVTHRMLKIGQNSIKCYYSYINYIYCYSVEGYLVGSISFYPEVKYLNLGIAPDLNSIYALNLINFRTLLIHSDMKSIYL
jgi:hypothetical protein